MLEEEKVVIEDSEVEVAEVEEKPAEEEKPVEETIVADEVVTEDVLATANKNALTAFILICIGAAIFTSCCFDWKSGIVGGIVLMILSIIALKKSKLVTVAIKAPYKVFNKIAYIAAKVGIPVGIVFAVLEAIYGVTIYLIKLIEELE